MTAMRVLVLGATGLLGNAVFRVLCEGENLDVLGTCRSSDARACFATALARRLLDVGDLEQPAELERILGSARADVVVNCLAAPRSAATDLERALGMYAVVPRRLAHVCKATGARLVHISTDGVFSGARGQYTEDDLPDPTDAYGLAKWLGEVTEPHTITLRTSMIGPGLRAGGLLDWFLSQQGSCPGYTRAVFSGLPTVVIGRIIRDFVIPRHDLHGVYHIAAPAISKYDLLTLVAERYGKDIEIVPDDSVVIDRSLVADRFSTATGFVPDSWPELVETMHSYTFGLA